MRASSPARWLLTLSVPVLLATCGGGESVAPPTTASPATSVPREATTTGPTIPGTTQTTTPEASTTTVPTETTTTVPAIDYRISGGEVEGPERHTVGLGETVMITIVSDVDDEIHVHGYDLYFELTAGVPQTLQFVADVPGLFEVEVHTGHNRVFDLEVTG